MEYIVDGRELSRHAQDKGTRIRVDVGAIITFQHGFPVAPQQILPIEDENGFASCTSTPCGHDRPRSSTCREHAAEHDIDPGDGQTGHVAQSFRYLLARRFGQRRQVLAESGIQM
jgi:hypothetical protein